MSNWRGETEPRAGRAIGYSPLAKLLHWLIVVLLIIQYTVAWFMPHIGRNTVPETLINLHFSLGTIILAVAVLRLLWRLTHPEPTPMDKIAPWQLVTAKTIHYLLYLLLLIIPILGWTNASYRGFDVALFGLTLPHLVATRAPNFAWTGDVHAAVSYYVMLPLIGLHAAASIYHAVVHKNGVFGRMLPSLR
jgi:cytochrome b561